MSLNLAPWWDEPDYKTCNTFHLRGLFILRKLREHDSTKFHDVITLDLYGHFVPGGTGTARLHQQSCRPSSGRESTSVGGHGWRSSCAY